MQRLWIRIAKKSTPIISDPKGGNRKSLPENPNSLFAACVLTREFGVVFAPNIRKLIMSWLDMYELGEICTLASAVEAYTKGRLDKRPNAIGDKELFAWADTVGKNMTQ